VVNAESVRRVVLEALHAIAPEADLTSLAPGAELRVALDLDSFDALQLLQALHRRLGVEVPEAVAGELRTLDQIVEYLLPRIPAAGSPSTAPPENRPLGRGD
jgi:acyl carrier protein